MPLRSRGYVLIMLLFVLTVMVIGLMVAMPVWQTQVQREKEEELIFRGKQYVEAVRIYQSKHPGAFPKSLDVLLEEKCIRRLYKDPMTPSGDWNLILLRGAGTPQRGSGSPVSSAGGPIQNVLVAPLSALDDLPNAQILGVVSTSTQKSFRIYFDQDHYDKWLFYYGQAPKSKADIVYFNQEKKSP